MPTTLTTFSVRNADRGTILATNGQRASSYWARFWGLMFKKRVPEGGGILLTRSNSIHSCFMRFRFDAIFLDKDDRVVKIVPSMRQWWLAFGGRGAKDTLELPAGVAERTNTQKGDLLVFEEVNAPSS
ncbi:MAG: DUF192 domain-containing protein [Dehalococcoidia bacterium]